MKYTAGQYAEALVEVLEMSGEKGRSRIAASFLRVLRRNGETAKIFSILREAERLYYRRNKLRKIELESAAPLSDSIRKEVQHAIPGGVITKEAVDPSLLGGIKILVDDEILIDASARRQLMKLFK